MLAFLRGNLYFFHRLPTPNSSATSSALGIPERVTLRSLPAEEASPYGMPSGGLAPAQPLADASLEVAEEFGVTFCPYLSALRFFKVVLCTTLGKNLQLYDIDISKVT